MQSGCAGRNRAVGGLPDADPLVVAIRGEPPALEEARRAGSRRHRDGALLQLLDERGLVDGRAAPLVEHDVAADHDRVDVLRAARVDERRDRIVHRRRVELPLVEEEEVGEPADLERPDQVGHAERLRAAHRRELEHVACVDRHRVAVGRLLQQRPELEALEHVLAVHGRAVDGHADVDPHLEHRHDRRDRDAAVAVADRVVGDLRPGARERLELGVVEDRAVGGDELGAEEADLLELRDRALAPALVPLDALRVVLGQVGRRQAALRHGVLLDADQPLGRHRARIAGRGQSARRAEAVVVLARELR